MILIDANLLIYARCSGFHEHAIASKWLDEKLNGRARVGLPWPSLLAFLRITTNARLFSRPLSMAEAWAQVQAWLALDPVWAPAPTVDHADRLDGLVTGVGLTPKLVTDAHLATLALEHGLILCSADSGFARFSGLRWENPLLAP